MIACHDAGVMDPLLAAGRVPRLAETAMRGAIVCSLVRGCARTTVDDALLRFEALVTRHLGSEVRPALLFAERDEIVRALRAFARSRLAARLAALRPGQVLAYGRAAAPFDLIVRGRRGGRYAVVFRRVPGDGRNLETLRRVRQAWKRARTPLDGVLLYDFVRDRAKLLLDEPGADCVYGHLRAS
jgi:hypothetical protein